MFLFFYGDNNYLVSKKTSELESRYRKSSGGDFDLTKIDGENVDFASFAGNVQAVPLLSTNRLIIVKNIFSNKNKLVHEAIVKILDKIPASTVVVFSQSGSVDRRTSLFKALNKSKNSHEFKNPEGAVLEKFVIEETEARGLKIERSVAAKLIANTGSDLWRIINEIEKLVNYCEVEVGLQDIDEMVSKDISSNVFVMLDAVCGGRRAEAVKVMREIIASGEPILKVVSVINYQYRTVGQIKDALESTSDSYSIAKICHISPYQVSKYKTFARSLSWIDLEKAYGHIVFFDQAIKSGKINDADGLKELIVKL